ncbi:MAG: polyphosphate kinase 1 [Longimicrobiales bacterium]
MKPQRILRYDVPDRDTLERVAADPLTGLIEVDSELDFFRDIFFDTDAGDLREKSATARLRVLKDGGHLLLVDVLERRTSSGEILRRRAEAPVEGDDHDILAGDVEPARLLRALIDPRRLRRVFEVETMRRLRTAGLDAPTQDGARLQIECDAVTLRRGEFAGELYELELRLAPTPSAALERAARAIAERHDLRPTLADTASRVRAILEESELNALEQQLRSAREVAVVAYSRGGIALLRSGRSLRVPVAAGSGAEACRRALRQAFGRARGRIRLLGTSAGLAGRPALQVWIAEDVADAPAQDQVVWMRLDDALTRAGGPGLREARTLAALHVVARSGLAAWTPAVPAATRNGEFVDGTPLEPLELVLQRLEAADGTAEPSPKEVPPEMLLNMELSRLAFDERILVMAEDPQTPLLERVRFLSMFASRRDDFFMTRVARFKLQVARGETSRTLDGLRPAEQLDLIAIRARQMTGRAYRLLTDQLLPDLEAQGIELLRWSRLTDDERDLLRETYSERLEAVLTPFIADPSHPFPHVRNLRPSVAATVRLGDGEEEQLVAIELPGELPRYVPLPGGRRFVPLEELIRATLPELYPGLSIVRTHAFRVTRSAQIDLDDDSGVDILHEVAEKVARRPFQQVIRLEVDKSMPPEMRLQLLREFQFEAEEQVSTLGEQDIYVVDWLVDLASLAEIAAIDLPALKWPPLERRDPLEPDRSVFDQVRERDRFIHFPYDAFELSVERFLREAAEDPATLAVKITLYRTSKQSATLEALRQARANGKDATVMVELKASFDERRNIEWARGLEESGIRVVFSPTRLKVHAKVALVVRKEGDGIRGYAYIGTGNLNATTASAYVDVGILTAVPELTQEVNSVFNLLTGYASGVECEALLVAPLNMRRRFLQLIEREIAHARHGREAFIQAQLNGLADRRLVGALYRASRAGVRIQMMVREICTLRPGVPGTSDNIQIVSLLGRFLQHARIFRFHNDGDDEYFIGSADWRPRNLRERIELVTPVRDPEHREALGRVLHETLNHPDAWQLRSDGTYVRRDDVIGVS